MLSDFVISKNKKKKKRRKEILSVVKARAKTEIKHRRGKGGEKMITYVQKIAGYFCVYV